MTTPGCLCLVLHAHLPYVRHPEYESFFEESYIIKSISFANMENFLIGIKCNSFIKSFKSFFEAS